MYANIAYKNKLDIYFSAFFKCEKKYQMHVLLNNVSY